MRKSERRVLILAVVVVVMVTAQLVFQMATERSRAARLAEIQRSAATVAGSDPEESATVAGLSRNTKYMTRAPTHYFREAEKKLNYIFRTIEPARILNTNSSLWTEADWSKIAQLVADERDLIRRIREQPADFAKGLSSGVGHAITLLKADAIMQGARGNHTLAAADVLAAMQLNEALTEWPSFMVQRMRIENYRIIYDAVQQSFDGGDVPPTSLSELIAHLEKAYSRDVFVDCLTEDLLEGLQTFSNVRNGGYGPRLLDSTPFPLTTMRGQLIGPVIGKLYTGPVGRPWLNLDEITYIDLVDRILSAAERPYYEVRQQVDSIGEDIENLPRSKMVTHMLVGRSILPPTMNLEVQARHEANLDLMQMGLLIEQHRAQHGSYPETLDNIAPLLGAQVPIDPFSGGQYRYDASDDGFKLYSVGWNSVDNGGQSRGEADIVWRGDGE